MRFKVFMGSFLGYAAYYLIRKNLSLASADMISEGLIDKQGVGIAASAVSIAYAFSKFIMGTLSDRSDARKFLTVGLIIGSLVMMSVGFLPFSETNQFLNVAMLFVIMLFVGVLSGMGWPPCGRVMAYWFSGNEHLVNLFLRKKRLRLWRIKKSCHNYRLAFIVASTSSASAIIEIGFSTCTLALISICHLQVSQSVATISTFKSAICLKRLSPIFCESL